MFDEDDISQPRENEARLAQKRRAADVRTQMATQTGRRFVWRLLVDTRFESQKTLFDTHGGRQSYLIGAYEVGRSLADEIRTLCPEQYLLMVRENNPSTEENAQ
ncbi:hypothetical protein H4C81_14195 [Pseudomonas monteilii]|uniref:hypothetical protein n=1 Tax=Pseudomonas monteilii TaxID=76759 RepID=UPI0015FE380A|nr:hypothetical protein [Pseudomonas monteilii]MBA6090035.1 hypothetical protein [Pseudomonas monteilii]